jgi:hypothetical protein
LIKLDVAEYETSIEKLITVFFRNNPTFTLNNDEIDWETLSSEGSLLIRVYCEYCFGALVFEHLF